MPLSEYYTEVTCLAQSVIPLMATHKVAATPSNYSLFFRYLQGEEKNLIASIDTYVKSNSPFTEEILSELKEEFPDPDIVKEARKSQSSVSKVLSEMFLKISDFSGESNKLSISIKKNASRLSEESTLDDIGRAVTCILSETDEFDQYNSNFQNEVDELTKEITNLKKEYAEMKSVSRTDQLTQVANRRALDEELLKQITLCDEEIHESLSVMMIDIDHFKKFNDTFGHLTGDKVLKYVAQRIKKMLKAGNFIGRFGGEEFIVLLPNTAIAQASQTASHIRNYFSTTNLTGSQQNLGKITVSIGIAEYKANDSSDTILDRADSALYLAKEGGRNQVRCSD